MSRKPANLNLIRLLKGKERSLLKIGLKCIGGFNVSELADYAAVNRSSIYRYVTGIDFPEVESRIAAVLSISVKDLRRKLGLPALKNRLPRKTTGRQNKYGAFTESGAG